MECNDYQGTLEALDIFKCTKDTLNKLNSIVDPTLKDLAESLQGEYFSSLRCIIVPQTCISESELKEKITIFINSTCDIHKSEKSLIEQLISNNISCIENTSYYIKFY